MPGIHVKKNDTVYVLSGKDSGKTGKVLRIFPEGSKAIVEGINFIQKHTKPNPQRNVKGGILPKESPIHVSKLMIVCKNCKQRARFGTSDAQDGKKKVRVCRKCSESLDD